MTRRLVHRTRKRTLRDVRSQYTVSPVLDVTVSHLAWQWIGEWSLYLHIVRRDYCVAWPCAFPAVTLHPNIDQIVVWLETHCWNLMRCRFFYVIPFGLICQQIKSSISSTVLLARLDYSFVHPGTKEVLEQPRSSSPLKTLQNDWLDGMKHIRYRVRQHSHHYRQRFVLFWKSAQSNKSGSSPSRFLNGDAGWTWHVRASLWIPQTDRPLKMVLRYGTVAFPAFVNHFD